MSISHSHKESRTDGNRKYLKAVLCYAKLIGLVLGLVLVAACRGGVGDQFDGQRAYEHVLAQVALGPRPVGSEAAAQTADYIDAYLRSVGWTPLRVSGEYRGVLVRNILAEKTVAGSRPAGRLLIGAHYDTRPVADRDPVVSKRGEPILGANDGASGVAVLLELARVFDSAKCKYDVVLAFFDGEDKGGIEGWPFSVGADIVAGQVAGSLSKMILVDMVGDSDLRIFYEGNSNPELAEELWTVARRLGYGQWFVPEVHYSLMDDHVPFLRRGVPSVDIIDFDYPYWHTTADTADKVSPKSLEIVGKVLLEYLYTVSP